jgi:ribosomal protein S18 acetylase RimI-like enzyme
MALYPLTIGAARVRAGSWRGSHELAYLVPLTGAATLTPPNLARIRDRLRGDGFSAVVTAAVGPTERHMLEADGFAPHELLHLLRHDLSRDLPDPPDRKLGIQRARRHDRGEILAVDQVTFDEFWRLDHDGLAEAIGATPSSRVRVVRNNRVIAYAVSGRTGSQGYLQRLAVDPSVQGRGLGTGLVADSLHWLKRRGAATVWVNTQEANATALELYAKTGFRSAAHQLTVLRRDL